MLRSDPGRAIDRAPTVEDVLEELPVRLTLVALRGRDDSEDARVSGPSATGLGLPIVLSSRLSQPDETRESSATRWLPRSAPDATLRAGAVERATPQWTELTGRGRSELVPEAGQRAVADAVEREAQQRVGDPQRPLQHQLAW